MVEKIKEIIADQLGMNIDDIDEDMSIKDDLGADSLDIVEFLIAVEDEFGVKVPDEDADNIKTVEDAVKYVEDHMEE